MVHVHVLIAGNTRLDEVPMISTAVLLLEVATPLSEHAVGLRFYLVIVCHEIWARSSLTTHCDQCILREENPCP